MVDPPDSFSFVHAADLHLDTPFSGVEASAPYVAEALRDASLHAFRAIIDLAVERRVDFVLFAGDIYDGAERGIRAQLEFLAGLKRLNGAGIKSFIVHGNHDPLESGWSAVSATWPELVTIFPAAVGEHPQARVAEVSRDGVSIATVQGISFKERATTENLSRAFSRPDLPGIHIGLLHCNVEGSPAQHANYSPCTIADLVATGLDYLALGHVHDRRVLSSPATTRGPWIVYSGNTQARTINETGAKGVYVVTVEGGVIQEPEFVACDEVRFVQCDLQIDECETIVDLLEHLRILGARLLADIGSRSAIVRVTLHGRGPLHQILSPRGALGEVLESLRSTGRSTAPFCWWERILDKTLAPIDLDEIRGRGDFSSDVLDLSDEYLNDATQRAELVALLTETIPRPFRKDLLRILEDENLAYELMTESSLRALDEIQGDT